MLANGDPPLFSEGIADDRRQTFNDVEGERD
jgi:hypothetical protein